jgi:hypothetical protein
MQIDIKNSLRGTKIALYWFYEQGKMVCHWEEKK